VSGTLGDAAMALRRGKSVPSDPFLRSRLDRPDPRVELGVRLRGVASAAIDVSDGLIADVGHVAAASGVAVEICAGDLPRSTVLDACTDRALVLECQAAGGDDYELAFTAPASKRDALRTMSRELGLPLTRVGTVSAGAGVRLTDGEGAVVALSRSGFDHFES
jgi:thiamine-monophosphate kinase